MAAPTYPTVIKEPIAAAATSGYITSPMPDAPTGTNAASVQQGFPPITMTSELSGGEPPLGQDMNGFLNLITQHTAWLQAGQAYEFDADVAAAIGGYAVGAIVKSTSGFGYWFNGIAGNSTDPDSSGNAGYGAGWKPFYFYGAGGVTTTGGATSVPDNTARFPIIVVTGALTSNATVSLPNNAGSWLIVNATTGGFTLTVNSFAESASVNIPQGGFSSPFGVYNIGDGNIYPTVAPLGVPISIAPTGLSLVQRDNNGYVYATYFNSSNNQENLPIDSIITEQGDGFFRKSSPSWFQSQLSVSGFAGQVSNGQVPQSAVTQYAAVILASAALTGVPTAPTAALGTATSQVASTAFVNPGSGVNGNGSYRKNADGTIDQWGSFAFTANGGTIARTFPIAFPNAVESVVIGVPVATAGLGGAGSYQADQSAAPTLGGFQYRSIAASNTAIVVHWEAKGR